MPNIQNEICNPTHLGSILQLYREAASGVAEHAGGGVTPIDITLPLKLYGGTTKEVRDSFDAEPEWASALLTSYIGAPERFRDYWRQMAAVPIPSGGVTFHLTRAIEPVETTQTLSEDGPTDYPLQNNNDHNWYSHLYSKVIDTGWLDPELSDIPSGLRPPPEEPAWSGSWPKGYYYTTLPQLSGALEPLLDFPSAHRELWVAPVLVSGYVEIYFSHHLYQDVYYYMADPEGWYTKSGWWEMMWAVGHLRMKAPLFNSSSEPRIFTIRTSADAGSPPWESHSVQIIINNTAVVNLTGKDQSYDIAVPPGALYTVEVLFYSHASGEDMYEDNHYWGHTGDLYPPDEARTWYANGCDPDENRLQNPGTALPGLWNGKIQIGDHEYNLTHYFAGV